MSCKRLRMFCLHLSTLTYQRLRSQENISLRRSIALAGAKAGDILPCNSLNNVNVSSCVSACPLGHWLCQLHGPQNRWKQPDTGKEPIPFNAILPSSQGAMLPSCRQLKRHQSAWSMHAEDEKASRPERKETNKQTNNYIKSNLEMRQCHCKAKAWAARSIGTPAAPCLTMHVWNSWSVPLTSFLGKWLLSQLVRLCM